MIDGAARDRFENVLAETKARRDQVRALVQRGRWRDAETDTERAKSFAARRISKSGTRGRESIQGETLDYQPASFLVEGAAARRAVGFVEVSFGTTSSLGSGFLISPRLFITNQHVVPNAEAAMGTLVTFDRELDEAGRPRATTSFALDPNALALFSEELELDFAVIALGARKAGDASVAELGFCPLSDAANKHVLGMNTNIVQHPQGMRKQISIRNNLLVARTPQMLLYETDTETGSSGSPVFNDDWDVVALHHYGKPSREHLDDQGQPISIHVNEGIRASAIFEELERRLAGLSGAAQELLEEALELGRASSARSAGPVLGPPRPMTPAATTSSSPTESLLELPPTENSMPETRNAQALEVVIPLRISISLDGRGGLAATPQTTAPVKPMLGRKAEAIRIDTDYPNRNGFASNFIPGTPIELPGLTGETASNLAPLRAGEPNAAGGELRYQNFSVKLHRTRKMAIYTATNIDGATYLRVDRDTGQVTGGAEGERWFDDPRTSSSFYLDQTFYSEWSTYFDRGHLTRRTDPTWGTETEADRANADTFHFTNCSPQHFRFNQSAKYWQGLERYVLENGVLAQDSGGRLVVFQGPLFDDTIDRMADSVQIPSSFFKVVCWKSAAGLKAVGLVADQGPLLDEPRRGLGAPQALPSVNINHWRVGIAAIEARAGLNFGAAVRAADTIAAGGQPIVGREALQGRRVARMEDLL